MFRLFYSRTIRFAGFFPKSTTFIRSSFSSVPAANNTDQHRRLVYQSHKRGILETCILLGSFADEKLYCLNSKELNEYDELINDGDLCEWDLYYWLAGESEEKPVCIGPNIEPVLKAFVDAKRQRTKIS
ncbi:hypothetical protein ACOME3_004199 [Neoechinorhynchus agilis]